MEARAEIPFDRPRLRRLAARVTTQLGIQLPEAKLGMLHGRLQRRLRALGLASIGAYEQRLADPRFAPAELVQLFDLATTNKTDFFREPQHFAYLTETALPALAADRGPAWTARVWCAGCSTGQEVYTLAMVLDDHAQRHPGFAFSILGTDISTRALREAAAATYDEALIDPVPEALRRRYLLRGRDRARGLVRIAPELRRRATFSRLNFMDERYPIPKELDVIFFRNVMIYFDQATQERVIERQLRHLRPGGYLFVGHAESLSRHGLPLHAESSSIYRKPS